MKLNGDQENGVEAIRRLCRFFNLPIASETIQRDTITFDVVLNNGARQICIPIETLFEKPDEALGMFVRFTIGKLK